VLIIKQSLSVTNGQVSDAHVDETAKR